jgi:RNA polymerase sigma factor (sigma-70 family)
VKRLTESQRRLAEDYISLARSLARPLKRRFPRSYQELDSASLLGLVEAARDFDPARGVKFSTFARFRIRGALADVGRSMRLRGIDGPFDSAPLVVALTPYSEHHGSVLVASEAPPVGSELDDLDSFERRIRPLPARHREVIRLYYLRGMKLSEVGQALGLSTARVCVMRQEAIEILGA